MALRKPPSVGSTTNPPTGSSVLKQSGGTFVMKVWAMDFVHSVHSHAETTGDGDADPVFEHNSLQNGRYIIKGAAVNDVAIGISALSGTSNPGTFILILGGTSGQAGYSHKVSLLVLSVKGNWSKTGVYIPLVVDGIVTGTAESTIEDADGS